MACGGCDQVVVSGPMLKPFKIKKLCTCTVFDVMCRWAWPAVGQMPSGSGVRVFVYEHLIGVLGENCGLLLRLMQHTLSVRRKA